MKLPPHPGYLPQRRRPSVPLAMQTAGFTPSEMKEFIKNNQPDEAMSALLSGDLSRMLQATTIRTEPLTRHALLCGILELTYKQREDEKMRAFCIEIGVMLLLEGPVLIPALTFEYGHAREMGVNTFARVSNALIEIGRFNDAIKVCRRAIALGLSDGTKGDYAGRITRIEKLKLKAGRP